MHTDWKQRSNTNFIHRVYKLNRNFCQIYKNANKYNVVYHVNRERDQDKTKIYCKEHLKMEIKYIIINTSKIMFY